jgi:hypothetical protein
MKRGLVIAAVAMFMCGFVLFLDQSAVGQEEVKIDRKHLRELKAKFVSYGYNPKQSMVQEGANLHFKLPSGVLKIGQTGVSSKFVLAGEGEASCMYQLIEFPVVKTGYGSGVGLAFDAPEENSWGGIEREFHPRFGSCYLLMTVLPGSDGKMKEQIKAVPTKATKGKIGLQRIKNELVFLAAESPTADLAEIHRFTFTDETIRGVRFFADPGGSPTALEARLGNMTIRAEEITGGIPKKEQERFAWEWPALAGGSLVVGVLVWWLLRNRKAHT